MVIDEATANIDYQTEQIIQKAIHELLVNSTIITIAHRIKTVLNFDRILVLENGNILEFDSPNNLLRNEKSYFYKLHKKPTSL